MKAEDILFDISFECGKEIIEKESSIDVNKFITNFISAFGWGDILVLKKNGKYSIISFFFPWTEYFNDVNFVIYRGLLSGILSKARNKKIILKNVKKELFYNEPKVIISE